MNLSSILTTTISILALLVAIGTIYYSNRNNRKQILVGKYEELFDVVIRLASYHDIFINLSFQAMIFTTPNIVGNTIKTVEQYNELRDKSLPPNEVEQIRTYLSRLEVLRKCYTKKSLYQKCEDYNRVMLIFFFYTVYPENTCQGVDYDSLPHHKAFIKITGDLKKEITAQIEAL